jgi:hypothetical protein
MFLLKRLINKKPEHAHPQGKEDVLKKHQISNLKLPVGGLIDDGSAPITIRSRKPMSDRTHERRSVVKNNKQHNDLGLSAPSIHEIPYTAPSEPIEIVKSTPKKISLSKEETSVSDGFSFSHSISCDDRIDEGKLQFPLGFNNSPLTRSRRRRKSIGVIDDYQSPVSSAISSSYESTQPSPNPFDKLMKQAQTQAPAAAVTSSDPLLPEIDFVEFKYMIRMKDQKNVYFALMRDLDYDPQYIPVVIKRQMLSCETQNKKDLFTYRAVHESNIHRFLTDDILSDHIGFKYIVPFINHSLCFETNTHILVMEFCEYGTMLSLVLERPHKATTAVMRRLLHDIALGLHFIHSMNVAHRDIKLENIMLGYNENERRITAKIGDFGHSTIVSPKTQDPYTLGSPDYAAPEILQKQLHHPPHGDLWAYGVCVFGALERRFPYVIEHDRHGKIITPPIFESLKRKTHRFQFAWMADDDEFIDLVEQLLVYIPHQRLTSMGILDHVFFEGRTEVLTPDTYPPVPP